MKQERHFVVDVLFVLALFGVFAVSALMLVTIGANVYQHTVSDMSHNYDSRTATAYITEKIRQADSLLADGTPSVTLGTLSGEPALVLTEEIDNRQYCTYLYLYEGWLKELYIQKGSDLGGNMPAAGQNILQLESLEYRLLSDELLSITMSIPEVGTRTLYLSLQCY